MKKAVFFLSFLLPGLLPGQVAITGFNHLALSVSDIEASTAFYRDILGLEPIEVPDDLKAIRSWFKFGGGQDLHLLAGRTEPVADNSRASSHYSLTIPDADAVEAFLKEKGLDYHRQQRFDGAWQVYIADPDGYVIELNEPPILWEYLLNGEDLSGWDTLATDINEQLVRDIADAFVELGLREAGYEYVILDDGWMARERDANGNLIADPEKFPSGMKALADYVHSKGLKFGLYNCAATTSATIP